jgi:hypothetical protein
MVPVETIPGMEEGGVKENGGGVNSCMIYLIYCKNICKYHNVDLPSTIVNIYICIYIYIYISEWILIGLLLFQLFKNSLRNSEKSSCLGIKVRNIIFFYDC